MGARDFYLKKPQAMAGQSNHSIYGNSKKKAENSPKAERERKKENREKKFLPNPIPDQTPVRSCAEHHTGPKQSPTTRAPTRTPSGEKGPEDSWLRVLEEPTKACRESDLIDPLCKYSGTICLCI